MGRVMKDSGIEGIGQIPKHWDLIKIKYLGKLAPKCSTGNLMNDSVVTFLPMEFVKNGYFINNEAKYEIFNSSYNMFENNDIIIAKVTPCFENGNIAIAKNLTNGIGFGSSELFVIRTLNENNKYLFYFMQNDVFKNHGKASMTGTGGLKRISADFIKNYYVSLPEVIEQDEIVSYLDTKCKEIDNIIENTKVTIEEYSKYKQSVITEAVTKGLNPNVEMKNSGVEWIGKIPNDWGIEPFKRILHERTEKNLPVKTDERLSLSIDKGVTLYSEKTTNLDRYKEDVSQYKLAYKGDLVLNSMNMIVGAVGVSDYFGCVSPAYYTYFDKTDEHYTSRYCDYAFRCKTMRRMLFCLGRGIMAIERGDDRVNTCRLKVSREDLRNLKFPLPNLEEQKEIVQYLDSKCTEIDELIAKKGQLLTELETYKKSLIYECVTGKVEV